MNNSDLSGFGLPPSGGGPLLSERHYSGGATGATGKGFLDVAGFVENAVALHESAVATILHANEVIMLDADNILIPFQWQPVPDRWAKLPLKTRQGSSEQWIARLEKEAKKKPKARHNKGSEFTTKAAKAWGRARGWKLIDEERSTLIQTNKGMMRKTNDLMIGADLMFASPDHVGLILVQAAGRYERAPHFARFQQRGGIKACAARACQFWYVEFVRGESEPALVEQWA